MENKENTRLDANNGNSRIRNLQIDSFYTDGKGKTKAKVS